jgi:TonB-linked SusC/RagA family outer membrane protein
MKKVLLALSFVMVFGLSAIIAQTTTITGTVTGSDDGMPIPGASVFVKGTTVGTVTQMNGDYTLSVPQDAETLVFSFVGMMTQEQAIDGRSVIDVALASDAIAMDEVVVVAYGTTTKKSFTGTATQVGSERIESKNVSNISHALAGEVSGVQVINSNGQPGEVADIRIRGIGSINGSRDPLFIVDGVPMQGDINAISPSDIASTTVLKDASATAIYGSRGANGVIIITTKTGKKGDSTIEVDLKHGVNMRLLPEYDVISSPEEFVETSWSALKTRGLLRGNPDPIAYANTFLFNSERGSPGFSEYYNMWDAAGADLIDPTTGKFNSGISRRYNPDSWNDALFQSNKRTEASLRISGGDENNSYFTSFSFLDDQGYYLNSDYERFTGRLNLEHQARPWLKGSMNMSFMKSSSNFAGGQDEDSNNGFWLVANMPPLYPVYARDADGNKVEDDLLGGYIFDYGDGEYGTRRFASLTNAVASSTYDVVTQDNKQFSGNAQLEAKFLKNFALSSTFGMEYRNTAYDNLGNSFYGGSADQGGSIYKVKNDYFTYTITNMLRYSKQFEAHSLSAFVAQEASSYKRKRLSAFKSKLVDPWGLELNNAVVSSPAGSYAIDRMLSSYFGQVSYDFESKYFFQGVVRRDGSSKFINEKWGTFGSLGGAWMLSSEEFMSSTVGVLNVLKLKASYGIIGEQGGIGEYSAYDLYDVSNLNDNISIVFDNKGNPDLTWEESKQFQVGAEFVLLNRIDGSIDYYSKSTDNLLFEKRMAPSLGYAIIQVNDGMMINSGVEIDLNINILKQREMSLDFGINGAFEKNEITEMPIDDATGKAKVIDVDGIYGRSTGHSLFDIYTYEFVGVDPSNGASQWNRYYNELEGGAIEYIRDMELYVAENKDRIGTIKKELTTDYTLATKKYVDKSPIPTVRGSFDLNFRYRGFSLAALFGYSLGGYGYDFNYATLMDDDLVGSNNWHRDISTAWKNPGDVTDVPAISGGTVIANGVNYSQANRASTRFITSTDYLSLNNIVLSYNFRKSLLESVGLKDVRVYVSGDNLWVSTKRKGFYPNTSEVGESSRYQYVALTSFTGGVNIKF